MSHPINQTTRDTGFSLIEVMVAMVIGMLGIIVMMQMFSVFEGQKRTTTGGDDAISGGAVSLYRLQRDIQQSGLGISAGPLIGCTVSGLSAAGSANLALAPVSINPEVTPGNPLFTGQDANTDTLLVISGNGSGTVDGDAFNSAVAAGATSYPVHTPTSFLLGDRVVATRRTRTNPCAVNLATIVAPAPAAGVALNVSRAAASALGAEDLLFNLGPAPTARAYAVRGGNLTVCDYTLANCGSAANNGDPAVWVPIANNVVSLRAQYGRDTTDVAPPPTFTARMDGAVDVWDQAHLWDQGAWVAGSVSADPARDTAACALLRVAAVRIALIARNSQPEKTQAGGVHVTPAPPLWAGSDLAAQGVDAVQAAAMAISLPDPDPAWPTGQDFRYKVFQTVIPLRNTTIQGAVPEC
jgi:type IV pilus assembly protein PilW